LINYQHLDNGYEMPDHGLFIAGVIHSIAPQAKLHLYEVLNKYGIGSLASIVWGLTTAINTYLDNTDKLIINCSFNLHTSVVTPRSLVTTTNPPILYLVDPEIPTLVMDPSFHQFMTTSLERIMENIFTSGRVIVACAGNEAEVGKRRPEARYPAAYENVIGVAALPRNSAPTSGPWGVNIYQPATYSNLADVPTGSGYMTLGGEAGVGNGVLGIYIHRFPKENAGAFSYGINDTGWAWWAGTSFAASIISAIIAVTAGAVPARSVKTAHKLLSLSFPNEASIYQERVIPVDQV